MTKSILITGSKGFLGKNLLLSLKQNPDYDFITFDRNDKIEDIDFSKIQLIIHLAGVNRPIKEIDFEVYNFELTNNLCVSISKYFQDTGRKISIIFTSSTQVSEDNLYGKSKLKAENSLIDLSSKIKNKVTILRLPGVFGKWCKPNYNSVVATFSYNISRDLPIKILNPNQFVDLVYIDDVINKMKSILSYQKDLLSYESVKTKYSISLAELAKKLKLFHQSRLKSTVLNTASNIDRALYSTFISYLPTDLFKYKLNVYKDNRGEFSEVIKTKDSGQVSYFTINPGYIRGGHYHHTKTEKFLVLNGRVQFNFCNLSTKERIEIITSSEQAEIVQSIPGWSHNIVNLSNEKVIVMLWANEVFDKLNPDTILFD